MRWTDRGIELEANPRHAEIVIRELGLEGSTPSKIPGVKAEGNAEKNLPASEKKEEEEANGSGEDGCGQA